MEKIYSLEISTATSAEVYEIVKIEENCRLAKWTATDYQKEIERETSLILTAKYGTKTTGFITCRFASPIELADKPKIYTELDVLNFGVMREYRRQGIGDALLDGLIERVSRVGVESIWLEVRESNLEAINLYKKKGFTAIQTRKNFYAHPLENALLLKLGL